MQLSDQDLQLLSQYAVKAALEAGRFIAEYAEQSVNILTKKSGSSQASQVVTEVDYISQAIILQTLNPTLERYDLALLSEEQPDDLERIKKDFFWSIDPLDGTLSFVQSTPGYAVSIALVSQQGTPHIGIIYDPLTKTLYQAVKGAGVLRDGKPFHLEKKVGLNGQTLTLFADPSFAENLLFSTIETELKKIAEDLRFRGLTIQFQAGAALNACQVLENDPACYFKFPKSEDGGGSLWDYAASACLVVETGAFVSDILGYPLDLNRPDTTFMNERGVLFASNFDLVLRIKDLYKKLQIKSS